MTEMQRGLQNTQRKAEGARGHIESIGLLKVEEKMVTSRDPLFCLLSRTAKPSLPSSLTPDASSSLDHTWESRPGIYRILPTGQISPLLLTDLTLQWKWSSFG